MGEKKSPPNLEEVAAQFPGDGAGKWMVIHTKSRQEKILAADLDVLSVAHYLPLVRSIQYYGNRKVAVEKPLFPGYLFLRGSLDQAYQADRTKRVAHIIQVSDQKQIDWELRNLFLALTQMAPLQAYPFLKAGMRVEVRSGPFRGLQGVIDERSKNDRLILQVNTLGRAVSLEIDGSLLEPIQ